MTKIFEQIASCSDPKLLRRWIKNAKAQVNEQVERAARLRLYEILPNMKPHTFEHDVWKSVHALEGLESDKRGKTVRLRRTRNLIREIGERACVEKLLTKGTVSKGYNMLVEYGLPDYLFEAIALRYPEGFSGLAIATAKQRMSNALAIGFKETEADQD